MEISYDNIQDGISTVSQEIRDQIGDAAFPFTKHWQLKSPDALDTFKHDYPDLYGRLMNAIQKTSEAHCPTCNE